MHQACTHHSFVLERASRRDSLFMSVTTTNTYYSLSRIFGLCVKGNISLGMEAALKYSPIVMQNSILKRDSGT